MPQLSSKTGYVSTSLVQTQVYCSGVGRIVNLRIEFARLETISSRTRSVISNLSPDSSAAFVITENVVGTLNCICQFDDEGVTERGLLLLNIQGSFQ